MVHVMPHPVDLFTRRTLGQIGFEYLHLTELRRRRRKKPLRVASLPGYLFVRFSMEHDPWESIYRMPGVIEILSSEEGTPVAISDEEMDLVVKTHRQLINERSVEWDWPSWKIGQELLITRGPLLAGCVAAFVAFSKKTNRLGRDVGGDATHYVRAIVNRDSEGKQLTRPIMARLRVEDVVAKI